MTREEAIKQLKENKLLCINSETEPFAIAYDMAIQALEQEPTTKNDLGVDCISRQEVLRLLANNIGKSNTYLQTAVFRMPSVTPQEPKTGQWIENEDEISVHCSECGSDDYSVLFNYCPNCGAKMVEEQGDNNMTEAQKTLYYIAENMKMDKSISDEGYEHFQQAIKALEQVSVLEDIKAEIKNMRTEDVEFTHGFIQDGVLKDDVLSIIDKHISGKDKVIK